MQPIGECCILLCFLGRDVLSRTLMFCQKQNKSALSESKWLQILGKRDLSRTPIFCQKQNAANRRVLFTAVLSGQGCFEQNTDVLPKAEHYCFDKNKMQNKMNLGRIYPCSAKKMVWLPIQN